MKKLQKNVLPGPECNALLPCTNVPIKYRFFLLAPFKIGTLIDKKGRG
jgi:hypothetical protein